MYHKFLHMKLNELRNVTLSIYMRIWIRSGEMSYPYNMLIYMKKELHANIQTNAAQEHRIKTNELVHGF
jgi:hypothetical protein